MKPLPLSLAIALLGASFLARRRLPPRTLVVPVAIAIALAVYGVGFFELPDVEQSLSDAGDTLGAWTYLLVGGITFLEAAAFLGLVAPGETMLVFGGFVAGQGDVQVVLLGLVVWAAALAGDVASYAVGLKLGRPFLLRRGHLVGVSSENLARVERLFASHGWKVVLVGHFLAFVQATAPFVAGASRMPLRVFLPSAATGAAVWIATYVAAGHALSSSLEDALAFARTAGWVFSAVAAVAVGALAVVWLRQRRRGGGE